MNSARTIFRYESTLVPESPWSRLAPGRRAQLVQLLWVVTWIGLLAGYVDRSLWQWVVGFSAFHALLVLALVRFRPLVFPAQLRLAYLAWVALGTFVPALEWMMLVTTLGLLANISVGWCPLARALYLLAWNRDEPFDADLLRRVFFSGPVPGRFRPPPRREARFDDAAARGA